MQAKLTPETLTLERPDGASDRSDARATVFVVDGDAAVRASLAALIERAGWAPRAFATGADFLAAPAATGPSCLVLDVSPPDLDGLGLQRQIADERAEMPILFIAGHGDVQTSVRAMKAGAVEFLTKPFGADVMRDAIRDALTRSRASLAQFARLRSLRDRYWSLSRREREVMALVAAGNLNKQVGAELGISEVTVKAHRGQVMAKMQAASLADLVRMSLELGSASLGSALRGAERTDGLSV